MMNCPCAKYTYIADELVNFHHDEKDKRIGFINTCFVTEELINIKATRNMNNDNLYKILEEKIEPYLKFFPGIGNIVNIMALKPKILEYIAKLLSIKEKS